MLISVLYTGEFGKKVVGNLVNPSMFCVSCGDLCDKCRSLRQSFADRIVEIHELPSDLLILSKNQKISYHIWELVT